MLKKTMIAASLVALSSAAAIADFQGPTATTPRAGVVNSVHDMRGYNGTTDVTVAGIDQERVCAFCHTPHHAFSSDQGTVQLDYNPLWSHEVNTLTFVPYQSTTLQSTTTTFGGGDLLIGPSRLCMSCHDGTIAVDTHYTEVTGLGASRLQDDSFNQPGVGWGTAGGGGDLANDHPIGFDYIAVAGATALDTPGVTGAGKDGYINLATTNFKNRPAGAGAITIAERLYLPQAAAGVGIMTCATCHDVHNRKNGDEAIGINYLVMAPQRDSSLCVSCHIK